MTYEHLCFTIKHLCNFVINLIQQNMDMTRSGEHVSPQIGKMGAITGLTDGNFSLDNGQVFNIKNDGTTGVTLEVQLAGMDNGEFIETTFEVGWNPEIVKVIKATSLSSTNLKWGY